MPTGSFDQPRFPVRPLVIRPGRPSVRNTFQLVANTAPSEGGNVEELFRLCFQVVLGWLQQKFPVPLPRDAAKGISFDSGVPGQTLRCLYIQEIGSWSVRLEQPDTPFLGRQAVPGRTWTTEISLRIIGQNVQFGIRVMCASLLFPPEEIQLTRPKIVSTLATRCHLFDVKRPLDGKPWYLANNEDLDRLRDFLTDPLRHLPVYLLTETNEYELGLKVSKYLLNENELSTKLQGLGHVVVMPEALTHQWTVLVGKPWSAFQGAIRTYKPGLRFSEDSLGAHPLALAKRILAFSHNELKAEEAFTKFLVDQAQMESSTKRVHWGECLFFVDALRTKADLARQGAQDEADWRKIYDEEIASLREKITELEKEAEAFSDQALEAEKNSDFYVEENRKLRAFSDGLRAALTTRTGEVPDAEVPIPDKYDELLEWAEEHLVGRLVLHSRTRSGIKGAVYEDPNLVYRALLLLATVYRDMRRGLPGMMERWETNLRELQLQFSGSIKYDKAGEQGDTYFIRYPPHNSQRRFLEFHLRRGVSHDPRHSLRIYFFWDDDTEQVVVGWLPSHLENRMT